MAEIIVADKIVDDIIEKTGKLCNDRVALKSDLSMIFSIPDYWRGPLPLKNNKKIESENTKFDHLINEFKKIEASCQTAATIVKQHKNCLRQKHSFLSDTDFDTAQIILMECAAIEKSQIDLLEDLRQSAIEHIKTLPGKRNKPSTLLIAHFLYRLYERCFGSVTYSKPSEGGEANGPAIRFMEYILDLLEIENTPNSIAKIIDRKRNGKLGT